MGNPPGPALDALLELLLPPASPVPPGPSGARTQSRRVPRCPGETQKRGDGPGPHPRGPTEQRGRGSTAWACVGAPAQTASCAARWPAICGPLLLAAWPDRVAGRASSKLAERVRAMCCLAGWGLRPGERRPDARTAGQRQARRAQLLRPLLQPCLSPHKMGQSGKASQRKGHGDRPSWSKEPALRPPGEGTGPERPEVDRLGVSNTPGSPGPWAGTEVLRWRNF
ncbi:translation initiation factor IF-2-like isoform X2 [Panthera uncia]|uniref:translation initiation factor IF-2-like isoform X2 n=1 Tax=Panthera uncia TaxID=29064 RepID=UPI0020FFAC12|nr:translation initiation factor IF-2-like isoform X2 [Panthera uncia]